LEIETDKTSMEVIDGALGARLLEAVKTLLQSPLQLLI
jgi:pyruvate/2-oxoglutarate dehydrogenase complex dihydrolipoamide acyltransferase (E2) component